VVSSVLEKDKERCFKLVEQGNKPEQRFKSFGEANAGWIASVTEINYEYRAWTSELDETIPLLLPHLSH
jgi:hypothetical protein